jgi:hypothetical protein
LRSNFDRASLLAPKAFFCYFFAALGKKVEDISANIYSTHLIFEQYQPTKSPREYAGRSFQQALFKPFSSLKRLV